MDFHPEDAIYKRTAICWITDPEFERTCAICKDRILKMLIYNNIRCGGNALLSIKITTQLLKSESHTLSLLAGSSSCFSKWLLTRASRQLIENFVGVYDCVNAACIATEAWDEKVIITIASFTRQIADTRKDERHWTRYLAFSREFLLIKWMTIK